MRSFFQKLVAKKKSERDLTKSKDDDCDYAHRITDAETWNKLAHVPNEQAFAHTEVIKVIYHCVENKFYFLQSEKWPYHYDFAKKFLGYKQSLSTFNVEMYLNEERSFILATIIYHRDQNIYSLELWPGDNLKGQKIVFLFTELSNCVFFTEQLHIHPTSLIHEHHIEPFKESLRVVESSKLFAGLKYQPLTQGIAFGTLKIFNGPAASFDSKLVRRDWIVVSKEVPVDIPPVAGLITEQLQTPLCHIALLCSNRKTPNMGLVDAIKSLTHLEGKLVKMIVASQEYKIEEAKPDEAQEWKKNWEASLRAAAKKNSLKSDLKTKGLIAMKNLDKHSALFAGSKATSLARISSLQLPNTNKFTTDNAFVIPFAYYSDHMVPNKAIVEKLMKNEDPDQDIKLLEQLRENIMTQPLDQKMLDDLFNSMATWEENGILKQSSGVIFRSSTNVEDLEGFNGAGLYVSESLPLKDVLSRQNLEAIVKRVWSSVWNLQGYEERKLFGLSQSEVQMAILVQPYLKEQIICNGVGITANPFRKDFDAFFINVQVPGVNVTDNCGGETPEQMLIYDDNGPCPELISHSSLMHGKHILTTPDVNNLFHIFTALNKKFVDGSSHNALDVEFLILKNPQREIVLLQSRPFKAFNLVRALKLNFI